MLYSKKIIFIQGYQYKKFLNIFIKPSFILHVLNNWIFFFNFKLQELNLNFINNAFIASNERNNILDQYLFFLFVEKLKHDIKF